jgi:hypothetical protein
LRLDDFVLIDLLKFILPAFPESGGGMHKLTQVEACLAPIGTFQFTIINANLTVTTPISMKHPLANNTQNTALFLARLYAHISSRTAKIVTTATYILSNPLSALMVIHAHNSTTRVMV